MISRLAFSGIRRQPLASLASVFFIAASTTLLALTALLSCQLYGSIDSLMDQAQVPDILQMHAGSVDEQDIKDFADRCPQIAGWQISSFLNLNNPAVRLKDQSLAGSTQDNGLVIQPEHFDFLLDLSGSKPAVQPGEVYVPVAYRGLYDLKAGDIMTIGSDSLIIAGFIRDAQMNAMMCSSKRFLVHPQTLERLQDAGVQETLIEFMLADGASPSQFRRTYEDAGLPASGPFIDRSLIRMMNVLSDGTVIFLLFLVSLAVLAISLLCIRYILFLQLEQDRQQTGMMKALGISRKAVRQVYLVHYALLTVLGILAGLLAALILQRPLLKQLRELYGTAPDSSAVPLACLLAASVIALIVLISVRLSLHSLDRQSPLDALRNPQTFGRSGTRFMSAAVCAGCTFLVLVPLFLSHTLSSPGFVTSMGIGDAQLRLDLASAQTAGFVTERLEKDEQVKKWSLLTTYGQTVRLTDGTTLSLPVETGDLEAFPVTCDKGRLPEKENELALSVLAARELNLEPGDTLQLEDQPEPFVISGLYSDITNGGKTAKALHLETEQDPVWTVGYVSLKYSADPQSWLESMSGAGISVTSIREYVRQTYAQTLHQLDLAAQLAACTGLFITAVVMFLAIRLSIQQNRATLSLKKALGFTTGQLKREWFLRQIPWCLSGAAAGLLLALGPGKWLCCLVLEQLGATGFGFDIPCPATLAVLVLICAAALATTWCSLSAIRSVTPCECLRGKEIS